MKLSKREIRKACGWSLDRASVHAGVSSPTYRIYELVPEELVPEAISDPKKIKAMDATCAEMARLAGVTP